MAENVTTAVLEEWVRRFAILVAENRDYLTELDSAIGDADHGANLRRGFAAVSFCPRRGCISHTCFMP